MSFASVGSSICSPAVKWNAAGMSSAITDIMRSVEFSCVTPVKKRGEAMHVSNGIQQPGCAAGPSEMTRTDTEALFREPRTTGEETHPKHKHYNTR